MDRKNITNRINKAETLGELHDILKQCEVEEDFIEFYKSYWKSVEKVVNEEKNIHAGDKRCDGEIYERVVGNIIFLSDGLSEMRQDFMWKVYWFLHIF